MQITPHFTVPSSSHHFTTSGRRVSPTGFLVGREQVVVLPEPADRTRSAEPPGAGAQPAEVLHRVAKVDQLPVEDGARSRRGRRSGCRCGSRRARRSCAPTAAGECRASAVRARASGWRRRSRRGVRAVRRADSRRPSTAAPAESIVCSRPRISPHCAASFGRASAYSVSRRILRAMSRRRRGVITMHEPPSGSLSAVAKSTSGLGTPTRAASRIAAASSIIVGPIASLITAGARRRISS